MDIDGGFPFCCGYSLAAKVVNFEGGKEKIYD